MQPPELRGKQTENLIRQTKEKTSCPASFEGKYQEHRCPCKECPAFLLGVSYAALQHEVSAKCLIKIINEQNTTTSTASPVLQHLSWGGSSALRNPMTSQPGAAVPGAENPDSKS